MAPEIIKHNQIEATVKAQIYSNLKWQNPESNLKKNYI